MPTANGDVTRVGVHNIQFYIPRHVSGSDDCVFDPDDEFTVATLADLGLLLVPAGVTPTVADVLAGLDPYIDDTVDPSAVTADADACIDLEPPTQHFTIEYEYEQTE